MKELLRNGEPTTMACHELRGQTMFNREGGRFRETAYRTENVFLNTVTACRVPRGGLPAESQTGISASAVDSLQLHSGTHRAYPAQDLEAELGD